MDIKNPLCYDNRYAILIIEKGKSKITWSTLI